MEYEWYLDAIIERIERRIEHLRELKGMLTGDQQDNIIGAGNIFCVRTDATLRDLSA